MEGPEIFLSRLNKELSKSKLPVYKIYIPLTHIIEDLNHFEGLKLGRLDGAIYYEYTSKSLRNFIKKRLKKDITLLNYVPNFFIRVFQNVFNKYLNRNNKQIIKKSDVIIFQSKLSKQMHEFFWGRIIKKNKIIYNGLKTESFLKKEIKNTVEIAITARFRLNKRLNNAINIINTLNNQNKKEFNLHVIGALDDLTKESINSLNLNNVTFYGDIEYKKIRNIYKNIHIGISPSMFDPCPNSVLEMMSNSIPVITTSASGAAELVGIKNLIVEEKLDFKLYNLHEVNKIPNVNYGEWVNTIKHVITNYNIFQKNIHSRFVDNFDIKIISKQYKDIILEHGI